MKRKIWIWIGGGVLSVLILFLVMTEVAKPIFSSADMLTEEEAKAIALQKFSGNINQIKQSKDEYLIELERKTGKYELKINSESGEVSSIKRLTVAAESKEDEIKKGDEINIKEEAPAEVINEEPTKDRDENKPVSKGLTEGDASKLALEQVPGTVDDIDLQTVNGIAHYLVEVEADDGREAMVEINAITGEIKSLTWDEDDDEDDNDD